jgi:hypothetical protein
VAWADVLLPTPANGIEDTCVDVQGEMGPAGVQAVVHRFRAAAGDAVSGHELDLEARYSTSWGQTIALGGACYEADRFGRNVCKAWLWTTWTL